MHHPKDGQDNAQSQNSESAHEPTETAAAQAVSSEQDSSAQTQGSSTGESETSLLKKEIENLRAELEKEKKEQLYIRADFDNYRKNVIKERSDLLKYSGERAIVEVLNVQDNFERALSLDVNASNVESFKKGVQLIAEELTSALKRLGVTEVESLGKAFDPTFHEALSSEPSSEYEPGFVTRVFRKPFKLHDKLIRTGQVVVAREADTPKS